MRVATMTGNETLTAYSAKHQVLDPGTGARDLTLPALTASKQLTFWLKNTDDTYAISLKRPAGTELLSLAAGKTAYVACNGSEWAVILTN